VKDCFDDSDIDFKVCPISCHPDRKVTYSRIDVPDPKLGRHAIIHVHGPPTNDSCWDRARIEEPYEVDG
jgi:hypothetical protein